MNEWVIIIVISPVNGFYESGGLYKAIIVPEGATWPSFDISLISTELELWVDIYGSTWINIFHSRLIQSLNNNCPMLVAVSLSPGPSPREVVEWNEDWSRLKKEILIEITRKK